jgi:hypothetical protein
MTYGQTPAKPKSRSIWAWAIHLGLASIADDVPAALARDTIDSIFVLGVLQAGPAVKAALAGSYPLIFRIGD